MNDGTVKLSLDKNYDDFTDGLQYDIWINYGYSHRLRDFQ